MRKLAKRARLIKGEPQTQSQDRPQEDALHASHKPQEDALQADGKHAEEDTPHSEHKQLEEDEQDELHASDKLQEDTLHARGKQLREENMQQGREPAQQGKLRIGGEPQEAKLHIDKEGNVIQPEGRKQANPAKTLTNEEQRLQREERIPDNLEDVKRILEEQVGLNKCFDVVFREMVFGGTKTGLYYINGFAKDVILVEVLDRLSYAQATKQSDETFELFLEKLIPHIQVATVSKMTEVVANVNMGMSAFFFEGETQAITIDAKTYPVRSTAEPDLEKVVRGSRDGFVETLLTNVTLIRRRLRDPRLMFELTKVGRRTHTDVCISYIQDIVDLDLVKAVKDKIDKVEVDGIPLAEKQLEEAIFGKGWNPYPMVRFTERPDVVAAHLLEGHVVVLVDTSPSAIILPTTFFHHVQHAEEYRQTPMVGTYLRWVRFAGIAASIFLLPLWFLLVTEPQLKPPGMDFIGPDKQGHLPLLLQFFIAEVGTDLMRMAAVHTPTPLATAMGLVAAILVGEIAVKTGLFVNEVILYLAVAAMGTFATPSYELSLANRLARLGLLAATAIFKVPGFVVGSTFLIVFLTVQRAYNAPYMWPFIPFNAQAALGIWLRRPFLSMKQRLSITKTVDGTRQPKRRS
ncbi:spore germination protein [Paenibacillus thalictri]|uniref:Spore germination protein n=1 Tax=Paenibacillus thalictri TaxID=2527873 RepID=A0A4Q9DSF0_9BACL|nr:spore germination protein [Paenibacillus thalictri]TBL79804.1 spore germination protein [Paenibacillus thalictri]